VTINGWYNQAKALKIPETRQHRVEKAIRTLRGDESLVIPNGVRDLHLLVVT
jgi:hypothetical protein